MKKIFIILLVTVSISAKSQTTQITVDSLSSIIKTIQKQITELQKWDTLAFTVGQMTLTRNTPTKQTVSINNYAAMAGSGATATKASTDVATLTTQLNAALLKITALETSLKALQTKVTALKAVSTTTTIIQ